MSDTFAHELKEVLDEFLVQFRSATNQSSKHEDPWERLETLQRKMTKKIQDGGSDQDLRRDRLEIFHAKKAVQTADRDLQSPQVNALSDLVKNAQFNIGPWKTSLGDLSNKGIIDGEMIDGVIARVAASPVGEAAVAALSAAALPIMAGSAAVAFAAASFSTFMDNTREYGNAAARGGGREGLAAATGIGSFSGLTPTQMADAANQFGDRLRGGGFGAAWMHEHGLQDNGDIYTPNKFPNFVKALDLLRNEKNEEKAMIVARQMGLSDFMSVRNLSDESWEELKKTTLVQSSGLGADVEAQNRANWTKLGNVWDGVKTGVGLVVGQMLTGNFRGIGGLISGNPLAPIEEAMKSGRGNSSKGTGKTDMEENTGELKNLTRTLKDQREILGGGQRARNAYDGIAWKGLMFDEANRSQMRALGAFTV